MLIKFILENYCSFKEENIVSLETGEDKASENDLPAANILGVKGANASGKTSLLKALTLLKLLIVKNRAKDEKIPVKGFFDSSQPTLFKCILLFSGVYYRYEFKFDKEQIYYESLDRKVLRWSNIFKRDHDNNVSAITDYKILEKISYHKNSSVIATLNKMKYFQSLEGFPEIYAWFDYMLTNISVEEGTISFLYDYKNISRLYHIFQKEPLFLETKRILKECDLGIKDIEIKSDLDMQGERFYYPVFTHEYESKEYEIAYHEESQGVKQLYVMLGMYNLIISQQACAVVDEFDLHLHPNLISKITGLFDKAGERGNKAQLIFTTHDTQILDVLGKNRVVFVNKEDNESYCYRLDEIPSIRNDRSMIPLYKKGLIGGVPKV